MKQERTALPFFRLESEGIESCYLVEIEGNLTDNQRSELERSLAPFFKYLPGHLVTTVPILFGNEVVSVGPRLTYATPFSSCATDIFNRCGFPVNRVECFRRYRIPGGQSREVFLADRYDRVTEAVYDLIPPTYQVDYTIPPVEVIPLLEEGIGAVKQYCQDRGIKFTEGQYELIDKIFRQIKRNPTDVAIYQLVNMWSDHCRHLLFNANLVIDKRPLPFTLFDLVREPYRQIKGGPCDNIVTAFHDNASGIEGFTVPLLMAQNLGGPTRFLLQDVSLDLLMSGETHNYPNHVASYEGSATEIGGELRDGMGKGSGSDILFAGCGRVLGSIGFPHGYRIPGEFKKGYKYPYPEDKRLPLEIALLGMQGWHDYANRFGKPCLGGFFYSGAVWRPRYTDGRIVEERIESGKPTCYGFAAGYNRAEHRDKGQPIMGCNIVQIGGGAFPIGFCGGAASSSASGSNEAEFDEKGIQRGNGEMENRVYQVLRLCNTMGSNSPILSIHDQGAGGPANVLTELIENVGGNLYLGSINRGDPSMSDLQVWVCEYQERMGLVVKPGHLNNLRMICQRESCPLEILGKVTGDGQLSLFSERDQFEANAKRSDSIVALPLDLALADLPPITIEDSTPADLRSPIVIPKDLTLENALRLVLRRSEVGSKEWITRGVDGSIGGLVVQNQYCGPYATPVADCSISALSRWSRSGIATSYGVQPFLTTLDPAAGARYSIGEAITNLMGVAIDFKDIQFICNWMWPASTKDGEVARMVMAAKAIRDTLIQLGKAIIGGKDSSSMATRFNEQLVKSLATIVFSTIAPVPDTSRFVTPEIQMPDRSILLHLDLAKCKRRLGGSSLGQALDSQLGYDCPDLEDADLLMKTAAAVRELIEMDLITAGHDISAGGSIVTVLEMCFAAGCGVTIYRQKTDCGILTDLFAEELGFVIEVPLGKQEHKTLELLDSREIPWSLIGIPSIDPTIRVYDSLVGKPCLELPTSDLRREWEQTGHHFRRLRINTAAADREWRNKRETKIENPVYRLTFEPKLTPSQVLLRTDKPRLADIRTEGSNGHPEMIEAFRDCGFDVTDIHMSDFRTGKINSLDTFQMIVGPGGFANSDALGAAVGWAMEVKLSPTTREIFERFNTRPDTLVFGVCNGAQWGLRSGWAPLPGLSEEEQPLFTLGPIGTFNHQWIRLRIEQSNAVMLQGMEGSILGAWVANAEGYFNCRPDIYERVMREHLAPLVYVDARGHKTSALPHCPSGNPVAAV